MHPFLSVKLLLNALRGQHSSPIGLTLRVPFSIFISFGSSPPPSPLPDPRPLWGS
jgi:hypothetical protein